MDSTTIKAGVRDFYAERARTGTSCGCGCASTPDTGRLSRAVGYSEEQQASVPAGADLGLGCGTPTALAGLREGDTVLDLGAGAGFDCFLAAQEVGPTGRVIGVDMTPEMVSRARANADAGGYANVEFRLGEIEALPVAEASVDVVLSNCVINLSPEKPRVFAEAFRVLKPGGRLAVSDIVLTQPLPPAVREDLTAYASCIGGAELAETYLAMVREAGFVDVTVAGDDGYLDALTTAVPEVDLAAPAEALPVRSLKVTATKPTLE